MEDNSGKSLRKGENKGQKCQVRSLQGRKHEDLTRAWGKGNIRKAKDYSTYRGLDDCLNVRLEGKSKMTANFLEINKMIKHITQGFPRHKTLRQILSIKCQMFDSRSWLQCCAGQVSQLFVPHFFSSVKWGEC